MFSFVYNENPGSVIIVFLKDGFCITVWSMVSAEMVCRCCLCLQSILLVDHPQTLEGGHTILCCSLEDVLGVRYRVLTSVGTSCRFGVGLRPKSNR